MQALLEQLRRDVVDLASRRGWTVELTVAREGIDIAFHGPAQGFAARVTPRGLDQPHFLESQTLSLAYLAEDGQLSPDHRACLTELHALLSRWEERLPPGALERHLETCPSLETPEQTPHTPPPPKAHRLATIKLSGRCQIDCLFCRDRTGTGPFGRVVDEPAQVRGLLERARRRGDDAVTFDGGEPTLSPLLADAVEQARRLGFGHVAVTTNGIRLGDPRFLAQLVDAGLTGVNMSVHALERSTARRVCGVDTTGVQRRAMKNVLGRAPTLSLTVSTVLVQENRAALGTLLRRLRELGPAQVNVLYVLPVLRRVARGQIHTASLEDGVVQRALLEHAAAPEAPRLRLRHFPRCRLPQSLWEHLQARGKVPVNARGGPLSGRGRTTQHLLCPHCAHRASCDFPLLVYLLQHEPLHRVHAGVCLAPIGRGFLARGTWARAVECESLSPSGPPDGEPP